MRTEHSPHEASHNRTLLCYDTVCLGCLFASINILIGRTLKGCNAIAKRNYFIFSCLKWNSAVTSQVSKHPAKVLPMKARDTKMMEHMVQIDITGDVCACTNTYTHTHTHANSTKTHPGNRVKVFTMLLSSCLHVTSVLKHTHTLFMKIFVPHLAPVLTFPVLLSLFWQQNDWRVCCSLNGAEALTESCCFSFWPIYFLGERRAHLNWVLRKSSMVWELLCFYNITCVTLYFSSIQNKINHLWWHYYYMWQFPSPENINKAKRMKCLTLLCDCMSVCQIKKCIPIVLHLGPNTAGDLQGEAWKVTVSIIPQLMHIKY